MFTLTANVPYNFGDITQLLNEVYNYGTFNTASVRNVYSPDVCTATELMVDQLAQRDAARTRYQFRRQFVRDARLAGGAGQGRRASATGAADLPPGTAQGIGDPRASTRAAPPCWPRSTARPATVNRKIENGYSGPRVTKMVIAVDVGSPINPPGSRPDDGRDDGRDRPGADLQPPPRQHGHFLEGSWDNAYYTRQWNVPLEVR